MRSWYEIYGALLRRAGALLPRATPGPPTVLVPIATTQPERLPLTWSPPGIGLRTAGDAVYGYDLLDRWNATAQVLCAPLPGRPDGTTLTVRSITKPRMPPATLPHTLCEARNLFVDYARIGRRDDLRHRPGYRPEPGAYPAYEKGTVFGDGMLSASPLDLQRFPRDHLRDIFDSFVVSGSALPVPEAAEIVEHPVLFITREPGEHCNLYHAHTDFICAYETLYLLGWSPDDTQVVLLDHYAPGPFDVVFEYAYSRRDPVQRIADYAGRTVLYRRAAFVPPGYSCFLFAQLWDEDPGAGSVGMLRDYGRFLLRAFGIAPFTAPLPPDTPVAVTVIARRPYRAFIDRGYLRGQIRDEEAVLAALRRIPGVRVACVDFATLSFAEQLQIAAQTEILIGAHGAGLAHILCMAEHGAAVEIVGNPAQAANQMFPHMGTWSGRRVVRLQAAERYGLRGTYLDVDPSSLQHAVGALAPEVRARRSGGVAS